MRIAFLTAVLFLFALPLSAAEPGRAPSPEQKARAALALAAAGERESKVSAVLAKVARDEAETVPVVAPVPRLKACGCAGGKCDQQCPACECPTAVVPVAVVPVNPVPPALPPAFRDNFGCEWTPHRGADGGVYWTRACPVRR